MLSKAPELTIKSEYHNKYEELSYQNNELIERVESLRIRRVDEEPLVVKAKAVNESLTNDLYELKRIEGQTTNEYDHLKSEKADLTERLHNNQVLRQNTEREVQKVRSRIVHSPEKLKQALQDMGQSLISEKNALSEKSKKSREVAAKIDALTAIDADLASCIKVMEECESELARVEQAAKRVAQYQELKEQKQLEVRELSVRDQQLSRQLNNSEDKLARATRQLEAKRESTRTRMQKIQEERKWVLAERMEADLEMDRKKSIIEAIEKKILELRNEIEGEVNAVQIELGKLKGHVELYMGEIGNAMEQSAIAA